MRFLTWLASVIGSLHCLGKAKTLSGRSLRSVNSPCFSCGFQVVFIDFSSRSLFSSESKNNLARLRFPTRTIRRDEGSSDNEPDFHAMFIGSAGQQPGIRKMREIRRIGELLGFEGDPRI